MAQWKKPLNNHQVLLRINVSGKEALVPLHAETLRKIDHAKKYMQHFPMDYWKFILDNIKTENSKPARCKRAGYVNYSFFIQFTFLSFRYCRM